MSLIGRQDTFKIERPSFFFIRQGVSPLNRIFSSIFLPEVEKFGFFPL
jgi:hypothetical protein